MKRALTGIAAAGIALGMLAPAAFAANTTNTTAKVVGTKAVFVNGSLLSSPYELTNVDSGNTTAYFGIYYFDQAVKALGQGFDASWDGTNHVWNITAPNLDASKIAGGLGSGNTAIKINGTTVKYINTFSHVDPAGGSSQTTYFPVWYVNEILAAIGAQGQWNPQAGLVANYSVGSPAAITLTPGATQVSNTPGSTDTLMAKVVDSNGHPVPGVKVDFYSNTNSLLSVPVSAVTDANGVATVTGTVGTLEGTDTVTATVDGNPNLTSTAYVTVQQIVASNAKMLNASQIEYTFNEAVDPSSTDAAGAGNPANYTILDASGSSSTLPQASSAVVQSDGKTVIVTLSAPIANGTSFTFSAHGVASAVSASRMEPLYSTNLTADNTTAPAVTKVTATTNGVAAGSVTVDFSEPVVSGATFRIDGQTAVAALASDGLSATLTPSSVLSPTQTHTLTVYGLTDQAGNTANVISQNFSVTQDTTAPTITSEYALNDHQIEVVFSKAMNSATVSTVTGYDETNTNVNATIAADPNDTTGTKYIVTIAPPAGSSYYSSTSSHVITLFFPGTYQDSYGNNLVATSAQVTLHEDTTAPVISGMTYVTNSSNKVTDVVLQVSKNVSAATETGIKVIDPSGADVTSTFFNGTTPSVSGNTVDLPVNAATLSGTYTFYLPAGAVTDTSLDGNTSAATTLTVNFGQAVGSFSLAESNIVGQAYTSFTPNGVEEFQVAYPSADTVYGGNTPGSATLTSDYTLNGAALPTGSYVTLDSTSNTVTIFVPANSITTTNSYASFGVSGVENTNGVMMTAFNGYVGVKDNTAPSMTGAKLVQLTNGTYQIEVTFNEAVNGGTVTVTNKTWSSAGTSVTLTPDATNPDVLVGALSGFSTTDAQYAVSVTVGSGVTDLAGNVANSATMQAN